MSGKNNKIVELYTKKYIKKEFFQSAFSVLNKDFNHLHSLYVFVYTSSERLRLMFCLLSPLTRSAGKGSFGKRASVCLEHAAQFQGKNVCEVDGLVRA